MPAKDISNIINFGLVVLTWMVQLVVYPSFLYYSENDLQKWHQVYTSAISYVVIPLMFAQLFTTGYLVFHQAGILNLIIFGLVVLVWIVTFALAVPAHNKIASGTDVYTEAANLVRINWYRTVIWSVIFLLGLLVKYKSDGLSVE
ncbi:MAG: hypothetical protein WBA74_04230 [Cyclobacteriaceae bacterium]